MPVFVLKFPIWLLKILKFEKNELTSSSFNIKLSFNWDQTFGAASYSYPSFPYGDMALLVHQEIGHIHMDKLLDIPFIIMD